jgi:putative DNA primase/helicase
MSCNRLPNFSDPSGALMKRMHVLRFRQSFDGRENTGLKSETGPLYRELPGILNWAIEGLRMLYHEDKRFIRPQSTEEVYDEMERVSAPVRAFVRDCLVAGSTTECCVPRDEIFRVYVAWARQSEGLRFLHSKSQLFKELRPLMPAVLEQRTKDPNTGRSSYVWWGLSLSETAQELGCAGPVFGA